MQITEDNFTITTIYFDGQFWCALIERCEDGKTYAGRHVFGAEPSNPEILTWMVHGFANVPLLPVKSRTKIRFKKLAKVEQKNVGGIPKSLTAFSQAQKEYAKEHKTMKCRQRKLEEKEKYLLKQIKRKKRK